MLPTPPCGPVPMIEPMGMLLVKVSPTGVAAGSCAQM